jgi:tetratricopeptide (TPR) repeat protein
MIPMKRTIFLVIFCLFAASFAQAQTRDVRRAITQLNRGNIANAKTMIDQAMQDPAAKEDAATYVTQAKVYMEIFISQDPEVKNLAQNPLEVAYDALQIAREKDKTNENLIEIQQALLVMSELTFNSAVEAFNAGSYSTASKAFRRSYNLAESFGSIDTTTLYNAGLAAELAREFGPAEEIYTQLIKMEYDQPYIFSSMTSILMVKGDTLAATNMIKAGRERYPDDLNLIFSEANIYIFTGQVEEAREILNLAIEKDPENQNLYFAFAANYDRMAQDTTNTLADRQFAYREAEKSYKKAIELDEDYFDAIYNLGVLYFNEGIRIFEEADAKLRKNPTSAAFRDYEQEEKRFQEKWLMAQPYLETAMEMLGDDETNLEVVVVSLMQLYARTNQPEKLELMQNLYHEKFAQPEE